MTQKIVTGRNLLGEEFQLPASEFTFRPGAYGILKVNNQIVLQRHPKADKFALPGGGIELEEEPMEAVVREFKEETGIDVKAVRLLDVVCQYFVSEKNYRSVMLLYQVEKVDGDITRVGNGEDVAEVNYFDLSKLQIEDIHWAHQPFFKYFN